MPAEVVSIAIPCEDCPLRQTRDSEERKQNMLKVGFTASGGTVYQSEGQGCGDVYKLASVERTEQIRGRILKCQGPDIDRVSTADWLGRLGLRTKEQSNCPAMPIDPTSKRQLSEYLGEQ